jgi:soluble lytic murein transglycosylase-like protein
MLNLMIVTISYLNGVDPTMLKAVCFKETRLQNVNNMHDGKSPSYGLCQVKKIVAKQVGMKYVDLRKVDLTDPAMNLTVAAKYLAYNIKRCGSKKSGLAAYNTGKCIRSPKRGGYVDQVLKFQKQYNSSNLYVLN